ncbi:hypothetical protein I41_26740 [Lacipirellula limnantheis]|uniref:PEP-CTERM protein-sorting domain-containing protein n=2 Tax=Lacipirellula limnantheis TaxID=2528024 RepID=A0A517TYR1_9BACT|nr:hypothetical protein I41_26740 [Lacipirellula limnantheis]
MKAVHRWALAALGSMFLWSVENCLAGVVSGVRTVALSGMPAPGTNETFGDVGYSGVSLNNRGETAFIASPSFNNFEFLFEPRPTRAINDESVWTEAGGSGLRRIAHEGPGLPGDATYANVARPLISDQGETIYHGSFSGQPAATQRSAVNILRNRLGHTDVVVAAHGSIAPSTSVTYFEIHRPSMNANGDVAFFGGVNASNFQGIWAEVGGEALDLVARRGDSAPGTTGTFRDLSEILTFDSSLAIGSAGHVAFRGAFFSDRTKGAIWLANPTGALQIIVGEGDVAPGANATFHTVGPPRVNGRGELAFSTGLSPTPNPRGSNDSGRALWRYSTETGLVLVAIQGQQAPGVDAVFASNHINFPTFRDPALGEGGHAAFAASLLQGNVMTESIWLADPSSELKMVARQGDPAPGTDDIFIDFGTSTVNARGQLAFSARTVEFSPLHHGIWAQDRNGVLRPIVKAGDSLNVNDNPATPDLREVQYLSFSEGGSFGSDRITGFNDLGQVAFFARFTDGTSGVFVSNAVAVPEPSSIVALGPLALMYRSRMRWAGH